MNIEAEVVPKYLWIKGPANISVQRGSVEINGAEFFPGEKVLIHASRSYIAKLFPNSQISIVGGYQSEISRAEEKEVETYEEWKRASNEIVDACSAEKCRLLVVGEADSGKTSFSSLLGNTFLKNGKIPGLLDADPGQNTIGLPGFLAAGKFSSKSIWPREIGWEKLIFLGRLSPAGFESEIIVGMMKLAKYLEKSTIIIDTDGWFSGLRGENYKYRIVNSLMPDFTILITDKDQNHSMFEKLVAGESEIIKLKSPPRRAIRSREERKLIKSDKIISLLSSSNTRAIDLVSVPLIIGHDNLIFVSKEVEGASEEFNAIQSNALIYDNLEGRLCALISSDGWVGGAGIVESVRNNKEMIVKTNYEGEVKMVQIGYIKLADNRLVELPTKGVIGDERFKVRERIRQDKREIRR